MQNITCLNELRNVVKGMRDNALFLINHITSEISLKNLMVFLVNENDISFSRQAKEDYSKIVSSSIYVEISKKEDVGVKLAFFEKVVSVNELKLSKKATIFQVSYDLFKEFMTPWRENIISFEYTIDTSNENGEYGVVCSPYIANIPGADGILRDVPTTHKDTSIFVERAIRISKGELRATVSVEDEIRSGKYDAAGFKVVEAKEFNKRAFDYTIFEDTYSRSFVEVEVDGEDNKAINRCLYNVTLHKDRYEVTKTHASGTRMEECVREYETISNDERRIETHEEGYIVEVPIYKDGKVEVISLDEIPDMAYQVSPYLKDFVEVARKFGSLNKYREARDDFDREETERVTNAANEYAKELAAKYNCIIK